MQTKKTKRINGGIWLLAALLILLLLMTWALLAGVLGSHTAPQNTIALTPEPGQSLNRTLYRPAKLEPDVQTRDETVQWEATTQIDLFRTAYENAQGAQTVKSESGSKVIAPGTENSYTFSIRNTGNVALNYSLSLQGTLAVSEKTIPLQFRLRCGDQWLVGAADRWSSLEELDAYSGASTLNPEKQDEYRLEWQWPYEGTDTADSRLGSVSLNADAQFRMTVTTTAEIAPGAAAVNGNGELLYEKRFTGGTLALLGADLGAGIVLLLLLLRWGVYVTGFAPGAGAEIRCGRKRDTLRPDGRFVFPRTFAGKHTFTLSGQRLNWRLERKADVKGLRFAGNNTVQIGRDIRAVELYLGHDLQPDRMRWAAVDKENRVYSPLGVQEPDGNGENRTVGGLKVDRNGKYSVRAGEAVHS